MITDHLSTQITERQGSTTSPLDCIQQQKVTTSSKSINASHKLFPLNLSNQGVVCFEGFQDQDVAIECDTSCQSLFGKKQQINGDEC